MNNHKAMHLTLHNSQILTIVLQLLLSLTFILFVSTIAIAQDTPTTQNIPTPEQMQKDAEAQGLSTSDLQRLGIDLSNPTQALDRAKSLGIPESQIQDYLQQYQTESMQQQQTDETGTETETDKETETETDDLGQEDIIIEPAPFSEEVPGRFEGTGRFAGLRYYGYNILDAGKGNFKALEIGPVDPGYIIGSGDVLRLYLWGDVEFQSELTVDLNGNISIPKAGQFFASGTRLDDLRENLKNYLSKYYSGLQSNPATIFMDISVARIRGNQIYLMGDVQRPGSYTISSFATAFNLMYATGGPTLHGSLREIRILRQGKIAAKVDFYDYMLKGNSTDDLRLQNNDIVFVPPRGTTVGIDGEIKKPGIYELNSKEYLNDLLDFAGGTKTSAYSFRVQIDRVIPLQERVKGNPDREMIDYNLADVISGKENIQLKDGDLIRIFPYTDILINYVDIFGTGITRPGRYELNNNLTNLSDLILTADSLTGDAYPLKADIVRTLPDMTQEYYTVDIDQVMKKNTQHDLLLWPLDQIKLYSKLDWDERPTVQLLGYSERTGVFSLPKYKTLYDLLFEHSGLQDSLYYSRAYKDKVDISRLGPDGKKRFLISKNLEDVWNGVPESNIDLIDKDIVYLYSSTIEDIYQHQVTITGHIKSPGTYVLSENMTLADLLRRANGFTSDAWVLEAEVSRVNMMGFAGETLAEVIHVPLAEWDGNNDDPESIVPSIFMENSEASNFKLKPSDHVRIRNNPDFVNPGEVSIVGEVVFPGTYTLKKENETLSDVIERAGGLTAIAHSEGGQFFRDEVRLFLDYHELLIKGDKREDVVLHPGDRIVIPKRPNSVAVFGEVNNSGLYKFIEGKKSKDYLKEAGGRKEKSGQTYIIYPSGRTLEITWRKNPKVVDGSTIRVLPEPPVEEGESIDWTAIIKDTLAILASAATIVAVVDRI